MGYIHIMLVGEHVGHVKTAFNDIKFQPIKRLYLLHSPNQTKACRSRPTRPCRSLLPNPAKAAPSPRIYRHIRSGACAGLERNPAAMDGTDAP